MARADDPEGLFQHKWLCDSPCVVTQHGLGCVLHTGFSHTASSFWGGQALPAANASQTPPFANIAERKRLLSIQLLLLEQEGVLQSPLCSLALQGSPPAPIPAPQHRRSPWQCHIAIVPACTAAMRGRGDSVMCKRWKGKEGRGGKAHPVVPAMPKSKCSCAYQVVLEYLLMLNISIIERKSSTC